MFIKAAFFWECGLMWPWAVGGLLTIFFCLLRAWSSPFKFTSQLFFLSSFCLPSDPSSSSKRLMPVFLVRDCRLELSGLAGAPLAGVMSPIRSTRAEPGADRAHVLTSFWADVWDNTFTCTYLAVVWLCHLLIPPPLLPSVCTGWWPESGCHWPVRYPLQMKDK